MEERTGIIGGTGLYSLDSVEVEERMRIETPWGTPSSELVLARMDGLGLAFLARHGEGHTLTPSEVPYAANIYALKAAGVRRVISVSAVGSLKEEIPPRDFVVPDQIFDRTKGIRTSTFFGGGVVGHVQFADPFCPVLRRVLVEASREAGADTHDGGTYVCMEGPAFSTRAESRVYRSLGMDVIGMTALPEAKLAREAGLCYATLALVTDYDVWFEAEGEVSLEMILGNLSANTGLARRVIAAAARMMGPSGSCGLCRNAASQAVATSPDRRDPRRMQDLRPILEP